MWLSTSRMNSQKSREPDQRPEKYDRRAQAAGIDLAAALKEDKIKAMSAEEDSASMAFFNDR